MDNYKKVFNKKYMLVYLLAAAYISINLIFLDKFPFVHSDESWLSGLSRNIMDNRALSVTESFFDIYVRNPHAIKIIFHSIQILFISLLGYSIYTVRLISFIFGILVLYFQYKLCTAIFGSRKMALVSVLLLGLDVQFIYASHFARQEIVLLFVLTFGLYYLMKNMDRHRASHDAVLGIIIGLSIGLHPNSFIISLPFGLIYLYHILVTRKMSFKNLLVFILPAALFAVLFVCLSLHFDPDFFQNYAKYGEQFDVFNPITSKFKQVKDFYLKLYYGVSGTYYTPDIRVQFFLFPAALIISLFTLRKNRKIIDITLSIIAINLGIILVGRYNQTSIVFIFPLFYILVTYAIWSIRGYCRSASVILLSIFLCTSTVCSVLPYISSSYNSYLKNISKAVGRDDRVLANLNTEYYFNNGRLLDYRNLGSLRDNNMGFKDYVQKNKIEYIIYPEEMDLIYNQRPKWNGLYGNLLYYQEMQSFFSDNCELVYEFTDSVYGIRIVRYINTKKWSIKIYKVLRYD